MDNASYMSDSILLTSGINCERYIKNISLVIKTLNFVSLKTDLSLYFLYNYCTDLQKVKLKPPLKLLCLGTLPK